MKTQTQRQKRVAEQVKQIIAKGFYTSNLAGTDLATRVTITNVNVSKDLKYAQVFFTLLGGAVGQDETAKVTDILNAHAPEINTFIAKSMATKYTPKVQFHYDTHFEEAQRVEALLDEVSSEKSPHNSNKGTD